MRSILCRFAAPLIVTGTVAAAPLNVAESCDVPDSGAASSGDAAPSAVATARLGLDPECIWPSAERLKSGTPLQKPRMVELYQKWFSRVLPITVRPADGNWNSDEWVVVPKLRSDTDYLVGHFPSRHAKVSRIEFQKSHENPTLRLTLIAEDLLPNRELRKEEIRELLGELLSIPDDVLHNLEIQTRSVKVGDDEAVLTIGRVLDARYKVSVRSTSSPAVPPPVAPPVAPAIAAVTVPITHIIPDEERHWYSPMHLQIAKGRLCVTVCLVDWQSSDRPMKGRCPK